MSINRLARGAATEEHYEFVPPPEVAPKQLIAGTSSVMAFQAAYGGVRYPPPTRRAVSRAHGGAGAAVAGEVAGPIVETVLRWVEGAAASDITYKFPDPLKGWKHVDDDPSNKGAWAKKTITETIRGPAMVNGNEVGLDLLVTWGYDGSSLGNVTVRPANPRDAAGWGLHVDVTPYDDQENYEPDMSPGLAAIRLQCTYSFSAPFYLEDAVQNMDVILFGNGKYDAKRY